MWQNPDDQIWSPVPVGCWACVALYTKVIIVYVSNIQKSLMKSISWNWEFATIMKLSVFLKNT